MYKLTHTAAIIRLFDNAIIPADNANSDYRAYLEWLDYGNTPDAADPEIKTASAANFRIALSRLGLRTAVESAISASSDNEIKDLWEFRVELHSNNSILISFAQSIGLENRLNEVFDLAHEISLTF